MPAWGERINDLNFLNPADREALYTKDIASYADLSYDQEQNPPTDSPPTEPPANAPPSQPAFRVRGIETGLRITYPAADADAGAMFVLDISVDGNSPDERFCYDLQPQEGPAGEFVRYGVYVWATPGVEIGVQHSVDVTNRITDLYWRGPLAKIPPVGAELPLPVPDWLDAVSDSDAHFSRSLILDATLFLLGVIKFTVDLAIGFSPVGDVSDAADLTLSFITGTNKWGEPVTNFDRAMLLGGLILPFVSSEELKTVVEHAPAPSMLPTGGGELLSDAEKLMQRSFRVNSLEGAGVAEQNVSELSKLEKEITPDRRKRAVLKAILNAGELLAETTVQVAESATRFVVQFGDVVSSHGGSFLDSELQWFLRHWRNRRLAGQALEKDLEAWAARQIAGAPSKPPLDLNNAEEYAQKIDQWIEDLVNWADGNKIDEAVPGSPLEYVRGQRAGAPHERLQLYLGEYYRDFVRGRTPDPRIKPLQRNRWPRLVERIWPLPGPNAVNDLIGTLTDHQSLVSVVQNVANSTRVALDRFNAEKTAQIIETIVERYKINGVLDAEALAGLIGRKTISQEEFIDRVLMGIDMIADEAAVQNVPDMLDDVLNIPGIESFIEQVVRKSGYENGYVFEVFLAIRELLQGTLPENLWGQVYLNGQMGPDFIRVILEDGQAVAARIVQAKSYRSLRELLGSGNIGEIQRQLLSDLQRLTKDGFQITGPNGLKLPIDEIVEFKIDWLHLRKSELAIAGIDPEKLHSLDPKVAEEARQAFYDVVMKEKINKINSWLQSRILYRGIGAGAQHLGPGFYPRGGTGRSNCAQNDPILRFTMTLGSGIIQAFYQLTAPLQLALEDSVYLKGLLQDLGWTLTLTRTQSDLIAQLLPLQDELDELEGLFASVLDGGSAAQEIARALELGQTVFTTIKTLEGLNPAQLAGLPAPLDDPASWGSIALDLPEFLLLRWLALYHPILYASAILLGFVSAEDRGADLPPRRSLDWDALGSFLSDPAHHLADLYHWGQTLDHVRLLGALAGLANAAGVPARLTGLNNAYADLLYPAGAPTDLRQLSIDWHNGYSAANGLLHSAWLAIPAPAEPGGDIQGVMISNEQAGMALDSIDLGNGLKLELGDGADLSGALGFLLLPGGVQLAGPAAKTGVSVAFSGSTAASWVLLGEAGATRLELDAFELCLALAGESTTPEVTLSLSSASSALRLVVQPSEGDSFLSTLLGAADFSTDIPFSASWSSRQGFAFFASAGFAIDLPVSLTIGPLHLLAIRVAVSEQASGLSVEITLSASVNLGPFVVVAEGLGLSATATSLPAGDTSGLFGSLDAQVGFLPPTGLGIAIDAGPVAGGGYLKIDQDAGTYDGILDLDLLSIGICAVALVDTRLPGGGWSFFLALYIEVPSIPLGFGFTLTGVGGVAGVNRTLDTDALQAAVRAGSLDSILFPRDPIANAPTIIAAMESIFPSASGRYVFGPVIQIGWGTPTLIAATVGIVISLPDPIVIAVIGSVSSVLPSANVDLVALYLDVAGVIDLGASTLSINSSLHGSHIAAFPLSGDMALRSAFGSAPSFLMALGGSHPAFERPSGFPDMERLSLAINAGELIDIRFDCYFAVSSNTLQFGAAFEMSAEVGGFGINGGAEFDALITFAPFSLSTELGYHISVQAAGVDLMAVWLEVELSGPNPWHVVGTATFTILGIDTTLNLDQKIGKKETEPPPASEDILGQLRATLALPEAWSVGTVGGSGVTFAAGDPIDGELIVAPDGTLGISQRLVPLGITLDKSDPWQIVGGYNSFDLQADEPGMASSGALNDWFVVSSFQDLSPREQLSAPSFEQLKAGIEFGGGDPAAGPARLGTLTYEQILLDPGLAEADQMSTFNLGADPRTPFLGAMASGLGNTAFTIAWDEAPLQVAAVQYAAADANSGAVIASYPSWSASHAAAGGKAGLILRPAWEILP